jgi:hypothetical protein
MEKMYIKEKLERYIRKKNGKGIYERKMGKVYTKERKRGK